MISAFAESSTPGPPLDLSPRTMNDFEFIQERENECGTVKHVLTGWESVVFQIEDEPPDD